MLLAMLAINQQEVLHVEINAGNSWSWAFPSFILLRRGERVIIRDCTCYTFISQIISGGILLHCVTVLHVLLSTQLVTTWECRQVGSMSRCSPRWRPTCVSTRWVTVSPCQPTSSHSWPRSQVRTSSNSQRAKGLGSVRITWVVNNS